MPGYENRLPPEDINVGRTNVVAEFFWSLGGFAAMVLAIVVALYLAGSLLAGYIPFSWELRLSPHNTPGFSTPASQTLQRLADRLAAGANIPKGIEFHIQFVDDDEVNAFATLGGVIRIHRGLTERLHSENAIALVLAHEMAHVIHRDPAQATGGRLLVSATLGFLGSVVGLDGLDRAAGMTSSLALLSFSRAAERRADALGLELVGRYYGHVGGVTEVFTELAAYESSHGLSVPEFLNNHPETRSRNELLLTEAKKLGISTEGRLTPLPTSLLSAKE